MMPTKSGRFPQLWKRCRRSQDGFHNCGNDADKVRAFFTMENLLFSFQPILLFPKKYIFVQILNVLGWYMQGSESYLVQQLQNGDKKAFETIFKTYYTGLVNYAFGLVANMETAKDLTEDIFYYIWENRKILRITHSLKGYLFKTIHNKCLDYLKREQVKLKHIQDVTNLKMLEEQENVLFASFYQPEYYDDEMDLKLKAAIDSLPEQAKKIFTKKRLDGKSYKEIANELNISENTVRKQMSRSLQKIKEALKRE